MIEMTLSQQGMAKQLEFGEHSHPPLKASAVRAIQRQRGEEACFSTDKRYSCAEQCEWRKDCIKLRAIWLR